MAKESTLNFIFSDLFHFLRIDNVDMDTEFRSIFYHEEGSYKTKVRNGRYYVFPMKNITKIGGYMHSSVYNELSEINRYIIHEVKKLDFELNIAIIDGSHIAYQLYRKLSDEQLEMVKKEHQRSLVESAKRFNNNGLYGIRKEDPEIFWWQSDHKFDKEEDDLINYPTFYF